MNAYFGINVSISLFLCHHCIDDPVKPKRGDSTLLKRVGDTKKGDDSKRGDSIPQDNIMYMYM